MNGDEDCGFLDFVSVLRMRHLGHWSLKKRMRAVPLSRPTTSRRDLENSNVYM